MFSCSSTELIIYYREQSESKLFFVLDFCAGGELFFHLSRMKKFSESWTRFYCAEIALALDELHQHVSMRAEHHQ
jgi:serine/threonine protein kinase